MEATQTQETEVKSPSFAEMLSGGGNSTEEKVETEETETKQKATAESEEKESEEKGDEDAEEKADESEETQDDESADEDESDIEAEKEDDPKDERLDKLEAANKGLRRALSEMRQRVREMRQDDTFDQTHPSHPDYNPIRSEPTQTGIFQDLQRFDELARANETQYPDYDMALEEYENEASTNPALDDMAATNNDPTFRYNVGTTLMASKKWGSMNPLVIAKAVEVETRKAVTKEVTEKLTKKIRAQLEKEVEKKLSHKKNSAKDIDTGKTKETDIKEDEATGSFQDELNSAFNSRRRN